MEHGIILAASELSSVNPITLKDAVIIGIALLGAAGMVKNLFGKTTTAITPDPLRIEKLDKFATRDFCEQRHGEVSRRLDGHDRDVHAIYEEIKRNRADNEVHASARSANIHKKIEDVRSELTGKIDVLSTGMNEGFKEITKSTERAIGRIEGKISKNDEP